MKFTDMPHCTYVNSRGALCPRRCSKATDPATARCCDHQTNRQNVQCQFVYPDGKICPNFHHTQTLICSSHGTKNRLEYMRKSPGWEVKELNVQLPQPYPNLCRVIE